MNWFEKLWYYVVSSNDEPFFVEIKKLEKDIKDLQEEISTIGDKFLDGIKQIEFLENAIIKLRTKLTEYEGIIAQRQSETDLERYWNNKRTKNNNIEYPARPPLDGKTNIDVDPRIFLNPHDNIIPTITGESYDNIANKALEYVTRKITYTTDPSQFKKNEAWLFSFETWKLKKGDCEDGAILLANIMLKSGIPYWRLRLNAGDVQGGGHCWVTYLTENNEWVILDWCYWPNESEDLKKLWSDAEKYFKIWFSWNLKYIFKDETLDR
jgi:hypothetical protein